MVAIEPVQALVAELRGRRLDRGLTMAEVAKRVGVGKSTLWKWEHQVAVPSFANAVAWAKVLGLRCVFEPMK